MSDALRPTPTTPPTSFSTRLGRALVVVLAVAAATAWLQVTAVAFQREELGVFSWKWLVFDQLDLSAAGYLPMLAGIAIAPVLRHLAASIPTREAVIARLRQVLTVQALSWTTGPGQ